MRVSGPEKDLVCLKQVKWSLGTHQKQKKNTYPWENNLIGNGSLFFRLRLETNALTIKPMCPSLKMAQFFVPRRQ